jgi:hypothetical protein
MLKKKKYIYQITLLCVCVCLCIPPIVARNRLVNKPLIVARLGKNPPIVAIVSL